MLDEAWDKHLQPKDKKAPTIVSLFAGCGGSSLGYSIAGFKELLAVEWDNHAAKTFKLNFPEVNLYHGDICTFSDENITNIIKPYELDILDGSPPCQGFSTSGKRVMSDSRNQLFREFIRFLRILKPKTFVMENVSGMIKGKMKIIFGYILKSLRESGYNVSARLMNTQYFNVPQKRQRMIFIGIRNDLNMKAVHPSAVSLPISVEVALKNCPQPKEKWDPEKIKSFTKKQKEVFDVLVKCKPGQKVSQFHPKKNYFSSFRIEKDTPARTIIKTSHDRIFHFFENRYLTTQEVKRLGSFPDQFIIPDRPQLTFERVGNSVPPLFMAEVGKHLKEILKRIE